MRRNNSSASMKLTDKFAEALAYAEGLHRNQTRKGDA
jgi:hypothetical protein